MVTDTRIIFNPMSIDVMLIPKLPILINIVL